MGWKRLFIFLAVVVALIAGHHLLKAVGRTNSGTLATTNQEARSASPDKNLSSASGGSQGKATGPTATEEQTALAMAVPHDAPIPKDALRLRIIANSDSAKDQQLKREVRDKIVVEVAKLVEHAKTEQQAQQIVTNHIQELQSLAQSVVREQGFSYDVKATVGVVPFPTKVYGNRVYPSGNYKALRLVIGKGQGANWWCVLFPPLCFIDIADGDAVPNTGGFPDLPPLETLSVKNAQGQDTKVQVRLASVDYGEELWKAIRQWL